jgi:hypothetical protein
MGRVQVDHVWDGVLPADQRFRVFSIAWMLWKNGIDLEPFFGCFYHRNWSTRQQMSHGILVGDPVVLKTASTKLMNLFLSFRGV